MRISVCLGIVGLGGVQGFRGEKKKGGPFTPMKQTSHWLHGNSIPKIGCHYFFYTGLIAPT